MTLDTEHFHATTRYKTPVMTILQYCRNFGESMKENVKKLSNWSAHYVTNHRIWYPFQENTVSFHDIRQLSQLPAVKMSSKDQQVLIEFSNVYGRSVRHRTGRQGTTMAKAGTLPSFCYNNTHSDTHVPLPQTMNEFNREEPMEEEAKIDNGENAEVEDNLPTRRRLEMKISLVKLFPDKISS